MNDNTESQLKEMLQSTADIFIGSVEELEQYVQHTTKIFIAFTFFYTQPNLHRF